MKENNKNRNNIFLIIAIFFIIFIVGSLSYAFFNYTRTGNSNVLKVGRISFVSRQTNTINLTNLFPIDPTVTGIMDDEEKVGTLEIEIEGDTDYVDGIEYLISVVDANIILNEKIIPISLDITVENLGTEDNNYFDLRESKNATIYKKLVGDTLDGNQEILVGYIKKNTVTGTNEGVNGSITITAYIDKNKIAITDTYPERDEGYARNPNMDINACVSFFEEWWGPEEEDNTVDVGETYESFCNGTGTNWGDTLQSILDNGWFSQEDIDYLLENNIIEYHDYLDGTTDNWVNNRVVFTTSEWNSLQTSEVSFKVKVEANEGIWVEGPPPTCPGKECKYIRASSFSEYYTTWNTLGEQPTVLTSNDYSNNYHDVINANEHFGYSPFFCGVILNDSNQIEKAYACGIKNNIPFCLEGTSDMGNKVDEYSEILQSEELWNNTCSVKDVGDDYSGDIIVCGKNDGDEEFAIFGKKTWQGVSWQIVVGEDVSDDPPYVFVDSYGRLGNY